MSRSPRRRPWPALKLKSPFGTPFSSWPASRASSTARSARRRPISSNPTRTTRRPRASSHGQMFPEGIMEKRILEADRAGLQLAIHAIGDRANSLLLDIFEKAVQENGPRDRRWRVEHAQHLRPADIARFGRLGLVAAVQPYHAIDDGRWAETKIGPERAKTTYAFESLRRAGAVLAFGSDWTVAPLSPDPGDLRRGDAPDARREEARRLGAGREGLRRGVRPGLHRERRLGGVRRGQQGLDRGRKAGRPGRPRPRHLHYPAGGDRRTPRSG